MCTQRLQPVLDVIFFQVKESSSMEFFLGSSPVHEEVDDGRGCHEGTDHHEAAGTDAPVGFEGRGLEEEEPLREREGRGEEEAAQQRRGEEEGGIQREEERTMLIEQVIYMCVNYYKFDTFHLLYLFEKFVVLSLNPLVYVQI